METFTCSNAFANDLKFIGFSSGITSANLACIIFPSAKNLQTSVVLMSIDWVEQKITI